MTKPDKDKLERATLDALTNAGVVHDDSRIVGGSTWKAYADGRPAGAVVTLQDLEAMEDDDQ
ncbi:RusA family crossover junction endodeoxyribonuclease [Nesterenkonia sp. NBAIMH1]|uniref:RusA family crossover junction endodeoxyribonuclease n=1 Tax=Nesterenkonia sp. NBAIMH1 TaxID=2600320 RepID=UPI0011B36E6A|nr:RusA family crossover junction endodeoxyribonuclease [Nesterenkonia sp. NBAIMH1]